jgi:hypothetical protein
MTDMPPADTQSLTDAVPRPTGKDTGPITTSPDPTKLRKRRESLTGWRRRLFDYVVVPAEIPDQYTESLIELHRKLSTGGSADSERVLAEAEAYRAEAEGRIDSAERRATTLQGTVAVAAGLVTAGAGLLLDSSKIAGQTWRIVLIVCLALFVACLVGCAVRSLGVTGRVFNFLMPGFERITQRAAMPGSDADLWRAAELLRAGAVAGEIGAVKVGLLKSAAWWLRNALGVLAVFAGLLAGYAISGPQPSDPPMAPATVTAAQTVTVPPRCSPGSVAGSPVPGVARGPDVAEDALRRATAAGTRRLVAPLPSLAPGSCIDGAASSAPATIRATPEAAVLGTRRGGFREPSMRYDGYARTATAAPSGRAAAGPRRVAASSGPTPRRGPSAVGHEHDAGLRAPPPARPAAQVPRPARGKCG